MAISAQHKPLNCLHMSEVLFFLMVRQCHYFLIKKSVQGDNWNKAQNAVELWCITLCCKICQLRRIKRRIAAIRMDKMVAFSSIQEGSYVAVIGGAALCDSIYYFSSSWYLGPRQNKPFIKIGLCMLTNFIDLLALLFPCWHIFQLAFSHWWKSQPGAVMVGFQLPGHRCRAWRPPPWPAAAPGAISGQTPYRSKTENIKDSIHNIYGNNNIEYLSCVYSLNRLC